MTPPTDRLAIALAGRYRIERELGAGGMATVYLAHDVKHDRKVAIKVLRPDLCATIGAERFLREIRTTAALRHPNILPLHDSGATGESDADDLLYYVMPFVDGESLRARMDRERQLPLDDALRIAREVADALGYAHDRGVIHRDIKPENILLEGGHAVVADFGIARAIGAAGGESLTQTGTTIGTPTYMSPEQSMGEVALDGRSDQYALACVLYEMLAGEPPYTGPTPQSVIAKRMMAPVPEIRTLRDTVPAGLAAALTRALAKAPADRFATTEEFARGLTAGDARGSPARASRRAWLVAGSALIGAGVLVAVMLVRRNASEPLPEIGRTMQVTRDPGLEIDPALSADGAMIAYAQGPPTRMQIYVQQVSGGRRIALTNDSTDNFRSPQWSPDATHVAFQGNDGIFVVASLGGTARRVVRIDTTAFALGSQSFTPLTGLAWSRDGTRLAYSGAGLHVLPIAGGEAIHLNAPTGSASPAWSPDGTRLALAAGNPIFSFGTGYLGNVGVSSIWVVPVAGGAPIRITDDEHLNASPQWSPDGRTLYWVSDRDGNRDVYQARLDRGGKPTGPPQRLTTGLEAHGISLSADGTHLAYSSFRTYSNVWSIAVPRAGPVSAVSARPVTTGHQLIEGVDVSADGRWLVFDSDRGGNPDIYRMPTNGGEPLRLTTDPAGDFSAAWSHDGRQIAFHSIRGGTRHIYTMNADGTGLIQRTSDRTQDLDPKWSPDGSALGFQVLGDSASLFRILSLSGGSNTARTLDGRGDFLSWSPAGTWIAYHAADGIRIVPPAGGPSRLVVDNANDGGEAFLSAWSPDGATLFYLTRRPAGWAIRSVAAHGGVTRPLLTFDDPTRQPVRYGFATDGRMFYLTIGSHESDVWVMTLERR